MRILVTGGAGYIGSCLVPLLLGEGHSVRVIDTFTRGGMSLLGCCANDNFEFVQGDICDEATMNAALKDIDAIVHLAAIVGQRACTREPVATQRTNVDGTLNLVTLRHVDQPLLYASSGSTYGVIHDRLCTEETSTNPRSLYARTKEAGERLVLEVGNAVVYRFATAFGVSPRMRFDLLPNDFVDQAVNRGSLIVYEGNAWRTFIHVRDMARSISFALREWTSMADEIFNVGDGSLNMSKVDFAHAVQRHVNFYLHLAEVASDPDCRNYAVSYDKIRSRGFTTSIGIDEGIVELAQAARLLGSAP
jgi:nucleoside-diphosphate-sugar epimerase